MRSGRNGDLDPVGEGLEVLGIEGEELSCSGLDGRDGDERVV
jgi:hypothetical protein